MPSGGQLCRPTRRYASVGELWAARSRWLPEPGYEVGRPRPPDLAEALRTAVTTRRPQELLAYCST
jgi:hypothetical protein